MTDPALTNMLDWLFAQQRFGVKLGLARVHALLERLGNPQRSFAAVLVGGTNGKGSVSSTLASILSASGRRTGLFTSPHLTHVAERFWVERAPLSEADLVTGLGAVRPHAEALGATFFEIVTALACWLFAERGVEIAVMEVGLGGRFDTTNALEPVLSIITNVALDHTEVLGATHAKIAFEKAGIMRSHKPVLTAARGAALGVLKTRAAELDAPLTVLGESLRVEAKNLGWQGLDCTVSSALGTVSVHTPLLGAFQAQNVALAVGAAQHLEVSPTAIRVGVERTRWAGRLEPLLARDRRFLLDGAHNPEAAEALATALEQLSPQPVTVIFGAAADKDIGAMVRALEPRAKRVIVTRAALSPRAASLAALQRYWTKPVWLSHSPQEALERALMATQRGEVIVVCGSLYLIGEVRPLLTGEAIESRERYQ